MTRKNTKRLYRDTDNYLIAGVCAGLAEYLNIDPTVVRIVFVILLVPGGLPGLVPYLILWFIIPPKPSGR